MTFSGWARLGIALSLLAACEVDNPENTMARSYALRMAEECDRFLANVRPSWDKPEDPAKDREHAAIVAMVKACTDLQNDIKKWGTD